MMPPITPDLALGAFDKFISIAKELAKLPALVLPQYAPAAVGLYEISQKLLAANENLSRWLYRFLYFDFRQEQARTKFLDLVRDYRSMKQGTEFQQLKFSCGDISWIYDQNIASKMGGLFSNQAKLDEASGIFATLSNADDDMVAFVYNYVIGKLDDTVGRMEQHVEAGAMNEAEGVRLLFKAEMRETTQRLEKFSGDLADLVMLFSRIARVPLTVRPT